MYYCRRRERFDYKIKINTSNMHRTPYLVKSELVSSINDIENISRFFYISLDHSNTLFLFLYVINFPSTMGHSNPISFRFILILPQAGVKRSKIGICIPDVNKVETSTKLSKNTVFFDYAQIWFNSRASIRQIQISHALFLLLRLFPSIPGAG